jgi:hypothetical protein
MSKYVFSVFLLLSFAGCSTNPVNHESKQPEKPAPPPVRETAFNGYVNTGMSLAGESGGPVLLFLDPAPTLAPETETPAALLTDLVANSERLRDGLTFSMALLPETVESVGNKPVRELVFLVAFPMAGFTVPPSSQIKGTVVRAKPGKLTHLSDVVTAYGPERERQAWKGKGLADLAMEGTVYWWGNTGVRTAADGTITHVTLRGKPEPAKK